MDLPSKLQSFTIYIYIYISQITYEVNLDLLENVKISKLIKVCLLKQKLQYYYKI